MAHMEGKVLITGVSGYIGFKTLKIALERGHSVRGVVRSKRSASDVASKSELISKALLSSQLEWAIVPDFLEGDAVLKVLAGVTSVVHLASPLAGETEEFEKDIIEPAVATLKAVLEAAAQVESVRRVVITSSCVTLIPFDWNIAPDSERLYTASDINSNPSTPYKSSMEAYWASKAFARIATRDFIQDRKPHFDFVNLLPSVVIGPDERIPSSGSAQDLLQGARGAVMSSVLGSEHVSPFPYVGVPVHVADVARAHVDAIDRTRIPGNTEFILSSDTPDGVVWDSDGRDVARKYFPEEVASGRLPLLGSLPAIRWRLEGEETERVFGWRFAGFEETMRGMIEQYLRFEGSV